MPEAAPAHPIGPAPPRRAGSVRRTSSIDTSWPNGLGQPMLVQGHARDIYTAQEGAPPQVLAEDCYRILSSARREILEISTAPERSVEGLIGVRGGGHLRAALAQTLPGELAGGSPLYLLLDDFSGASLVAGWAWSRWTEERMRQQHQREAAALAGRSGKMRDVCIGFRRGSPTLLDDGSPNSAIQSSARVGSLVRTDDPEGWHALPAQLGVGMRRARRVDAWFEGVIHIDAGFQDSATSPDGGRVAIHEYHLTATADPLSYRLLSISAEPRVLPFYTCTAAPANTQKMLGTPLSDFRSEVLERLPGPLGCTHLNDVLRSLAEVPLILKRAPVQL